MAVASNTDFSVKDSFIVDDETFGVKEINKARLVVLVFQHNNLWRVDSPEFSQKAIMEQSWRQISSELGVNVENWDHVKRKWKTVKDEYVKWHRYCNNPPPVGIKVRKRAYKPLFQTMEFLDPYLRHRNTGLTMKSPGPKQNKMQHINGHMDASNKLSSQAETGMLQNTLDGSSMQTRAVGKLSDASNPLELLMSGKIPGKDEPQHKRHMKDLNESTIHLLPKSMNAGMVTMKNGPDGVRHFLDDISVTLQKLPENKLQYAKMKIQLFLYNLQYGSSDFIESQENLE